MRPSDLAPVDVLGNRKPHGTRLRYMAGCKCVPCRAANSRYETDRRLARSNGDWNGIVKASRARKHLLKLRGAGVGRRGVSAVTGISETILQAIGVGRRKNIRARTERKILAVTRGAVRDHALIPAGPTWKRVQRLLNEGFTKRELARRIGSRAKVPTLQLNPSMVIAKNARKVKRLYRTVMA